MRVLVGMWVLAGSEGNTDGEARFQHDIRGKAARTERERCGTKWRSWTSESGNDRSLPLDRPHSRTLRRQVGGRYCDAPKRYVRARVFGRRITKI
jgi:hypothetical protein